MTLIPFNGNRPNSVNKDSKYSVVAAETGRGSVIRLIYNTGNGERWLATTDQHPGLVAMVNGVKTALGLAPHGSFYINEYKQVIVPNAGDAEYYLAGTYDAPLRFSFENRILTGEPLDPQGRPLRHKDPWDGPHPGIPYILEAGGKDIRYTIVPRPNVEKRVNLMQLAANKIAAARIIELVRDVKGFEGGRFYVNEFGTMFAPVGDAYPVQYIYIGQLDLAGWFPKP